MFSSKIDELILKGENSIYPIAKIELWLLKYQDYNKWCQENNVRLNSCSQDVYCVCCHESEEGKFISLYDNLLEAIEYHKYEEYAKNELIFYKNINDEKSKIKEWLIKNEKIATEFLGAFIHNHLDYSESEEDNYNLLFYRNIGQNLDVFIKREDFENIIKFLELFDEFFYVQKLYPEAIERIEKEW